VRAAQRETYETLLPAGVRIWEYQPSMMHSKVMLVDDRIAVIGSTNIDALSFDFMEEASLVIDSPAVAKELERALRADLRNAREIRNEEWERRNPFMELGREMAALLRRFL
jgi:cardiolipin synthase